MSNLLWKYYLEDDVDRFKNLLANGYYNSQHISKGHGGGAGQSSNPGTYVGSPGASFGTSPRATPKARKSPGYSGSTNGTRTQPNTLTRSDLNSRDQSGLTVLHRAASATSKNAWAFAIALIEHPAVDIYTQDRENGWTALHRALYFGNVTIARALLERDSSDTTGQGVGNAVLRAHSLIKVKDHEGNSAFDVYNATIARRTLQHRYQTVESVHGEEEDNSSVDTSSRGNYTQVYDGINGDEIFAFGSNKNLTLGFGDEDDRQHPEKIILKRPDHLLYRFFREDLLSKGQPGDESLEDPAQFAVKTVSELPILTRYRPIIIKDVVLSKLHSAILTNDPESNLHMCGFGPGGRLGMGDETTRFNYACVEGGGLAGKKITAVALGQNHSVAVSSDGTIFTWGTNTWGQLGYSLPRPVAKDEDPINTSPRQIFGPLKREVILGVAASAIHSVAYTSASLYTFGKNEGQLGLMDSDSRSLEVQTVPRRVAASLFTAPIQMVSAISKATICLLANHTVYVFTNYGYNNVKFPIQDSFASCHLNNTALTSRYEVEPGHISMVSSGGDTLAAISNRGDLFTIGVNQKPDSSPTASSTTNPTKIRNALSQPQRVWSLRKGHWDGVKSVGVGENGSVIICTQAGAVWHRIKRVKIKDAYASGTDKVKSKDFKFQRVPGLTNVAAVRSNVFGGYAAIRKDCDIMTQIQVNEPALWNDLGPLFSLRGLEVTESRGEGLGFLTPGLSGEHFSSLKRAVLISADFERDVLRHIRSMGDNVYDVELSTTLSDASIPVHGFMVTARSPVLRNSFHEFRKHGTNSNPELNMSSMGGKLKLQFQGLDFLTVFNFALYIYSDDVVDVWHFTRHAPKLAFRFRQIRAELMKLAAKLGMSSLESAVRLMSEPERRLSIDMKTALAYPYFFEDGDVAIQLDGGDVTVHKALVCQRCPFFEGLFKGRAAGQWLAGRNKSSKLIKIDMKHIDPTTFEIVLQYLYADTRTELFDGVVCADIDEFCDIVMDVISVANELMLDRLSQICQQVIGQFVTTRNICHLINAVAPCSITKFKDAGLEYLCLQLEAMLENHLLDDLEEDLLLELDGVVRANQLACLPFVKSGRMELLLRERHPSLAQDVDAERQRKIRDMVFRSSLKEEDSRLSSSRMRVGSLDDVPSSSPSHERLSRKLKSSRNAPFSPSIRPKDYTADLMFDMDEDSESPGNPASPNQRPRDWANEPPTKIALTGPNGVWHDSRGKVKPPAEDIPILSPALTLTKETGSLPMASKPWSLPMLPSSRVDMRDIMAQASAGRTSSLSLGLSAQKSKEDSARMAATPKISQKERKKQKQQALRQAIAQPQHTSNKTSADPKVSSPWQLSSTGAKISLNDVIGPELTSSPLTKSLQLSSSPIPPLDLSHRRTVSPDTRFAGQHRGLKSSSSVPRDKTTSNSPGTNPLRRLPQSQPPKLTPLIPHSKSYANPTTGAEPSLQLTMADIIGQQKREQDIIKEAVAKRSLQEIQEEQAFQEWWDKESQKAQEEEALRKASNTILERGGVSAKGRGNEGGKGGNQGGDKGGERAGHPRRRGHGVNNGGQWQGRGKGKDKRPTAD